MAYQVNGTLGLVGGRLSYSSFSVADGEQTRQWLRDEWSTPEQQRFNAAHFTCPVCKGRGYAVYRRNGVTVRDSIGCATCGGLGAVPRLQGAESQTGEHNDAGTMVRNAGT